MLSVVIPCYNESAVLPATFERLSRAAESWQLPYEVIVVDDGSEPATWQALCALHARDARWKPVRLARNFGQQAAISAGLARARGQAVMVIDADLQDPPELLQTFIDKWREGYQVIYGVRRRRKESWPRRVSYRLFYRCLRFLSQTPMPLDAGDFSLLDRRAVDALLAMPEHRPFLRGMRAWLGFRQLGIEYERAARHAGSSHYTLGMMLALASDGILAFSTVPLRMIGWLGLLTCAGAALVGGYAGLQALAGETWGPPQLGLGCALFFLGGVQLLCLGVVGEYVGRIYQEVKRRPGWVESEARGFEPAPSNP